MEHWKAIPGWEGFYEASDLGRIRSLDRIVPHRKNGPTLYKGRVLNTKVGGNGYVTASLSRTGQKPICQNVHTLVLRTFKGEPPPGHECCHWTDNALDNRLQNLRWGTPRANLADARRNGIPWGKRKK
jgi:hypothetical protein